MEIRLFQVDAFASEPFCGNPAAVCPLDDWPEDELLQAIASENNLSETAFFVRGVDRCHLRWFTPVAEVELCGHATLATAWVLFHRLGLTGEEVLFDTLSGRLSVRRIGDVLVLDFPSVPAGEIQTPGGMAVALGAEPSDVLATDRDYLTVFPSEADIRELDPDFGLLRELDRPGLIATAPGLECDFVSRFFAPALGVPEDPVTGSAHCTLTPYWSDRLGKNRHHARQISSRGGDLLCEQLGDRVSIAGRCAPFLEGTVRL
jgi:predicted PhzF superfamily epimerase YddE/YHI9